MCPTFALDNHGLCPFSVVVIPWHPPFTPRNVLVWIIILIIIINTYIFAEQNLKSGCDQKFVSVCGCPKKLANCSVYIEPYQFNSLLKMVAEYLCHMRQWMLHKGPYLQNLKVLYSLHSNILLFKCQSYQINMKCESATH